MAVIFIPSEWQSSSSTYSSVSDLTENLNANNFQIVSLKDPTLPTDAVNKRSVESLITTTALAKNNEINMMNKKVINLGSPAQFGDAVNKLYVDNICSNFVKFDSDIDMKGKKMMNLASPQDLTDAVTKSYVDSASSRFINKDSVIDMKNNKITNLASAVESGDAVNKSYIDSVCGDFIKKDSLIDMKSNRITNLGTPVNATDAVSKSYVDSIKDTIKPTSTTTTIVKSELKLPLYFGYLIVISDYVLMKFKDISQKSDAELDFLKIETAGVHNIRIWLQIYCDNIETVSLKILKNSDEPPIIKKVFYKTDDDHDSFYSAMTDFEKGDTLTLCLAGTNQFTVHYFIELQQRGVLPEIKIPDEIPE
jgi:hypothetical protein